MIKQTFYFNFRFSLGLYLIQKHLQQWKMPGTISENKICVISQNSVVFNTYSYSIWQPGVPQTGISHSHPSLLTCYNSI